MKYDEMRERAAARNKALSLSGRDIGELPAVVNLERKEKATRDFRYFCEQYFPTLFYLPWSADHLKIINKIEQAVLRGGLFAVATPRGFGKSSLCEVACLWAILYGHRDFVVLIGADEGHAQTMLESIKVELSDNDLLLEDFPEAVYPIHRLEGISNRCAGQLYMGKRTHITWTAKEIVLPIIPGSRASGAIIRVAGLTGAIRGMKHKRADGRMVRPSLVILDDPQTDESARSYSQCATRESILAGAILGLAGPNKKIAGIMPCTVIRPGDLADSILDATKHPEWNGERTKLIYSFPTNMQLWDQYAELRADSFRRGGHGEEATEFYRMHQKEMDEGAVVAWPERYYHDELSAIQHAMNLKLQDEQAFWAEYQNDPLKETALRRDEVTVDQLATKLNRMERGEIPIKANFLTMFIDSHQTLLYFLICAWEDDFTGYVIDYGTFPPQRQSYFYARDAHPTLAAVTKAAGVEGAVYAGLERLTNDYLAREFQRQDGAIIRIERCLIDANWGQTTDVIYQFCRQSPFAAILTPSHGRYVGASARPFNDYHRRPGDRCGLNWRIPNVQGRKAVRYVVYDTNYWKSFVYARLATTMGDRGCLSFFGNRPEQHRLLFDHLLSEYRVPTQARGRTVDEWRYKLGAGDNHWFDCLTGCTVAASIQGASLPGIPSEVKSRKQRISFAELQRRRKGLK